MKKPEERTSIMVSRMPLLQKEGDNKKEVKIRGEEEARVGENPRMVGSHHMRATTVE